ncbi:hypothetical protein JST97_18240 [bacterium]|nr:hypothetical protein [bacterium]
MIKSLLLALMLVGPALAQDAPEQMAAGSRWQIVLVNRFSLRAQSGPKEFRRMARPVVSTADGSEASIRIGGLSPSESSAEKEQFDYTLTALPKVQGEPPNQRIRLKLKLVVDRAGSGPLRQSCTLTASPGETVEFTLESPESHEEYLVEVTPWILAPTDRVKGLDSEGRLILEK